MEENNIFKFATKELSQDAFIAWCINWINYKNSNLYYLAQKILKDISCGKFDVNEIKNVKIIRQYLHIDILLIITLKSNKQCVIIIEDKKYGTAVENQKESFYIKDLMDKLNNNDKEKEKTGLTCNLTNDMIIPVYWKTMSSKEDEKELIEEINKKIKKYVEHIEVKHIDGKTTLNYIRDNKEDYTKNSEIVKAFYNSLEEKLKERNKIDNISEIRKEGKLYIGTQFATNMLCYSCFGKEYKGYPKGGVNYRKRDEYVHIAAISGIENDKYKNEINTYEWKEYKYTEELFEQPKTKYQYVFLKEVNEFGERRYKFYGLYKFHKLNKDEKCIIWKQVKPEKDKKGEFVYIKDSYIDELYKK